MQQHTMNVVLSGGIRVMISRIVASVFLAQLIIVAPGFHRSDGSLALAQGAATVTVQEPVAVVSNSYERAGGFAYDAVVIFWVRNTSPSQAAVNVPFRVTIEAGGTAVYTSDGRDTVTVWPMETRLVAFRATDGPPIDLQPERASVQVYPGTSMMRPAGASSQDRWVLSEYSVRCPGLAIECEVTGDLTWTGTGSRRPVTIAAAVFQGGDDGPVVGGGTSQVNPGVMETGQVAPFRVSLRGFDQPTSARAPELPEGPFSVKIYVESPP
jgi:hypothetical protein